VPPHGPAAGSPCAISGLADASARTRLERWLDEATALRADRSADGALMLADPRWGDNVACEPAMTVG